MKHSLSLAGFALALLVAVDANVAYAANNLLPCQGLTVDHPIVTCTLQIHHSQPITLRVKSPILGTDAPDGWKIDDDVQSTADTIVFQAEPEARSEQLSGVYVIHTRRYSLYLIVSAASSADVADGAIVLEHASDLDIFNTAVMAKARTLAVSMIAEVRRTHAEELSEKDAEHAEKTAKLQRMIDALQRRVAGLEERALVGAVIHGNRVTPIQQELDQGEGFSIRGTDWVELGTNRILRFDVYNHENDQFSVTSVQVFNEDGTREHTGTVELGSEPVDAPADALPPGTGPLAVIEPKRRASGAVLIRDHESLGRSARLVVHGPTGTLPQIRVIPIDPEKPTLREKQARQVMAGLRVIAGAFWFSDGTGLGAEKATSMLGVGVHLQKGFGNGLALEAEIQLARTEDARFDDVVVGESTGELTRNATVGRLILGGSAGFGYPTRAGLRIGLGIQGASNDAVFRSAGNSMEGPGASRESTTFLVFGASVRRRLGKHAVIGVEGSIVRPDGDDKLFRRSIEIGVHFGFGWSLANP